MGINRDSCNVRFHANGPAIPDYLLQKRDEGRCVFLCGAGVSIPAGMPTFVGLAQYVIDKLDPDEDDNIMRDFLPWKVGGDGAKTPLDQLFNSLYQEYGRGEINSIVCERLGLENNANPSRMHQLIRRISADLDRNPQVVTTNFDRLFENGFDAQAKDRVAPNLPVLEHGDSISGITYLHGRIEQPDSYVLGSADFGRAYLAEAWATNFIRQLIKHHTVVLVGYSAEDPPVKYLLQGLSQNGGIDQHNLYAFDRGRHEDIEAKWRDRGVTPIAYQGEDGDHSALWTTFEAWAERADDPRAWRGNIIDLARQGPRSLEAYQRGQVAHVVRTTAGARAFSDADPKITPEWLCVFDVHCRTAKSVRGYGENAETFDPFESYCLDDDPIRLSDNHSNYRQERLHDHLLGWRLGDNSPDNIHNLGAFPTANRMPLPSRLSALSNWISENLDSPLTAWWAFRQWHLHSKLLWFIRYRLRRQTDLSSDARRMWNILVEMQTTGSVEQHDIIWPELMRRVRVEGWSNSVMRDLQNFLSPKFFCNPLVGVNAAKPPFGAWADTNVQEIAYLSVRFPDQYQRDLEISDSDLESIISVAENCLRSACMMLQDLNVSNYMTPTCYPGRETEGEETDRRTSGFFRWFLSLFTRMIECHPGMMRNRVLLWPENDPYFFRKLKLFAYAQKTLFSGEEVVAFLLDLNPKAFWDFQVLREVLFLIQDRWVDFSSGEKETLIEMMLPGLDKELTFKKDEGVLRWNRLRATYVKFLSLNGCELSTTHAARLSELITTLPNWSDAFAAGIVRKNGVNIGYVKVDEASDVLDGLSVTQIADMLDETFGREWGGFIERRPFIGLVKKYPRKALLVLSIKARQGVYLTEFWSQLIGNWPEDVPQRLFYLFVRKLGRLPFGKVRDLEYVIGRWISSKFHEIYTLSPSIAWEMFDHFVASIIADDSEQAKGEVCQVMVAGEVLQRSPLTYEKAMNGPIGLATDGMLQALNALEMGKSAGIPKGFRQRLEQLLATRGKGGDQAVCILARYIGWLYGVDPVWVVKQIVPLFSFDDHFAEPAWSGFLHSGELFPPEIALIVKPSLLQIFPMIDKWKWSSIDIDILVDLLTSMTILRSKVSDGLTIREMRGCLRKMNEGSRNRVIYLLQKIGLEEKNGWVAHVIPFIANVWPLERKFRTSESVSAWVFILSQSGDDFQSLLQVVRKFLVPVSTADGLSRLDMGSDEDDTLVSKFPQEVLCVLDAVMPTSLSSVPYELSQILSRIEKVAPELVRDRRFFRLINLVESQ